MEEGPATWLAALLSCVAAGGTLAKIESQTEQDLVYSLVGRISQDILLIYWTSLSFNPTRPTIQLN